MARRAPKTRPPTRIGWLPFALLSLLAVGCAAQAKKRPKGPRSMSFQVDPESDLWAPAKSAAEQWSKATGRAVTVTSNGDIPIFFVDDLVDEDCGGPNAMACSYAAPDSRIEVLQSVPRQHLLVLLLHEMGHHLRGEKGHVRDSMALMAEPIRATSITPVDVEFICERFDCALPV